VQADAGKAGGTIERLLVEHGQIRQNTRTNGKRQIVARKSWSDVMTIAQPFKAG
jgi:hypothetical protein